MAPELAVHEDLRILVWLPSALGAVMCDPPADSSPLPVWSHPEQIGPTGTVDVAVGPKDLKWLTKPADISARVDSQNLARLPNKVRRSHPRDGQGRCLGMTVSMNWLPSVVLL